MCNTTLDNFEDNNWYQLGVARQQEISAEALVSQLAKMLADTARPIWSQGDGHGGYVRLLIERELIGLYGEPATSNSTKPKRKELPNALRKSVYERDKYRCVDCRTHLSLTVDHIIPVSRGGSDDSENLRTLCLPCNSKKGARLLNALD